MRVHFHHARNFVELLVSSLVYSRLRRALLNKCSCTTLNHTSNLMDSSESIPVSVHTRVYFPRSHTHVGANSNHVWKSIPVSAHTCVFAPRSRTHVRANSNHVRKLIPVAAHTRVYFPRSHTHVRANSKHVRKNVPSQRTLVCTPRGRTHTCGRIPTTPRSHTYVRANSNHVR